MKNLFIFDLDDTLIPTKEHYYEAWNRFFDYVKNTFGSDVTQDEVNDLHNKKQLELISQYGFNKEVFPESFRFAYSEIASRLGMSEKEFLAGADSSYKIGKTVFSKDRWKRLGLLSGVRDTLDFLACGRHDELAISTIGDDYIQKRKVKALGLDRWFREADVHVDLFSKVDMLKEISRGRNSANVYFVGNSWKSDMVPALEVGINPIYIPDGGEGWHHNGTPDERLGGCLVLDGISQIEEKYDDIVYG